MTALAPTLAARRTWPVPIWAAIGGLAATVALLLATRQATILRAGFPILALATAIWVYRRASFATYVAFAWWFWFLTPGIRRLVDYQLGSWDPENPMSVVPLMVGGLAAVTVVRRLPELRRAQFWPWIAAVVCLVYGFFVGVLRNGILPATHSLASWLVPLLFGLAIALEWRRYPDSASRIRTAFLWGGLALSIYAIIQFLNPPAWDRLWVQSSAMASVGIADPFEMRVFSFMNGPLLFAVVLLATILLAFAARGGWRVVAVVGALIALMLTLVRSVWLLTVPGVLVYLYAMPPRLIKRAAIAAVVTLSLMWGVVVALPSEIGTPITSMIRDRALTLGSLDQDLSYSQRSGFLDQISGVVLDEPLGHGLGSTGVSSTLGDPTSSIRDFDNGVFAVLYSLGWFGGVGFLAIAAYLTAAGMARREARHDLTAKAARAIVVAMLLLSLGSNVFEGPAAMVFWTFAGLLVASHRWHGAMHRQASRGR